MRQPCPHLPIPGPTMDWRSLHAHRNSDRGPEFYLDCLRYAQSLWLRGLAARSVLCLDRAFGAELRGDEPVLEQWPFPYAALAWVLAHAAPAELVGNPRIHFQHYAGRMRPECGERRRWRAWACWSVARAVLPGLPGDPKHPVEEPSDLRIESELLARGCPGESEAWRRALP